MFKGLGNLANLGSLVKQAQEMGSKMQAIGEELKTRRATGTAGGGLIEVDVNGLAEVLAVRIDPGWWRKGPRDDRRPAPAAFNTQQKKQFTPRRWNDCRRHAFGCEAPLPRICRAAIKHASSGAGR